MAGTELSSSPSHEAPLDRPVSQPKHRSISVMWSFWMWHSVDQRPQDVFQDYHFILQNHHAGSPMAYFNRTTSRFEGGLQGQDHGHTKLSTTSQTSNHIHCRPTQD